MSTRRPLADDCFLHDRDRMRHHDVVKLIVERLHPVVGNGTVGLDAALGRYLCEAVTAPRNVPLYDNSAVDGYAFSHAEYERLDSLALGPRAAAGDRPLQPLKAGTAARIFTGAIMPPGTDTVAMQEDCVLNDGSVQIPEGLKPGANRRRAGEDLKAGDPMFAPGHNLRPQDVAALASIGMARVPVFNPLRVALVSTGNEIVDPGTQQQIADGLVFDANRHMLSALCHPLPVTVTDLGILRDDSDTISKTLKSAAADHDIILTTGGASKGEEDHIIDAIDRLGKRHLWQIAIKPGRPMSFGQIGSCVFIGLPGNPVAAFVCFLLYCYPALRILGGGTHREPVRLQVAAGFSIDRKKPDRREFLRGWLETDAVSGTVARKFERDGSGLISGLRSADGLIELDEDRRSVKPGDPVSYIPLSQFGIGSG
ncbi:MAG: gephyrin-like molybdotransferase Glp [Pseudomonadota bacterium]